MVDAVHDLREVRKWLLIGWIKVGLISSSNEADLNVTTTKLLVWCYG